MNNEICGLQAVARYTWPGMDEAFICLLHTPQLIGLATYLEFHLQVIPLDLLTEGEGKTCSQHLSEREAAIRRALVEPL